MISYVSSFTANQVVGQLGELAIIDNPAPTTLTITSTTSSAQSIDVNLVQTSKSNQVGGRKNCNHQKKNAPIEKCEQNAKEPNDGGNKWKKKVKFPSLACKEDHFNRFYPHLADVQKYVEQSKNPPPVVLTNPFPTQQQKMVAQVPKQQPTNHSVESPPRDGSSSINILMADSIDLTTQAKSYGKQPEGEPSTPIDSPLVPQSNGLLTLDKLTFDSPSCPSKGALWHTTHNLNA